VTFTKPVIEPRSAAVSDDDDDVSKWVTISSIAGVLVIFCLALLICVVSRFSKIEKASNSKVAEELRETEREMQTFIHQHQIQELNSTERSHPIYAPPDEDARQSLIMFGQV